MNAPYREITAPRFWLAVFSLVSRGFIAGGLVCYWYEDDRIRQGKYQGLAAIALRRQKMLGQSMP